MNDPLRSFCPRPEPGGAADPTSRWPAWGLLVTFPFVVGRARRSPAADDLLRWPAHWPEGGVRLGQAVLSPLGARPRPGPSAPPPPDDVVAGAADLSLAPTLVAGGRAFRVRGVFTQDHGGPGGTGGNRAPAVLPLSWTESAELRRTVAEHVALWVEEGCPPLGGGPVGAVSVYLEEFLDVLGLPPLLPRD